MHEARLILSIILPFLCAFTLLIMFYKRGVAIGRGLLMACIVWGVLLAVMTEALSCFHAITTEGLTAAWLTAFVVLLIVNLRLPSVSLPKFSEVLQVDKRSKFLVSGLLVLAGITLVTALLSSPNNFDSLTYHLGRIIHWIQNRSVGNYPTHILRQLYSAPFSEYTIMHFMLLSGGDRLANLVQWFAMIGSVLAVTQIAKQLGCGRRGALTAAVICMTIPIGILQSSSTQNDYVAAFWMTCFVWASLLPREKPWGSESLGMGASLGLAILTKGTAYIFGFPFLVWAFMRDLGSGAGAAFRRIIPVLTMVLALNCGQYVRTMHTFGSPVSTGDDRLVTETFGIRPIASTMLRNFVMQFATPVGVFNRKLESTVVRICRVLGSDQNDPRTSMVAFSLREFFQLHEDFATNPLHTLLIVSTIGIVAVQKRMRRDRILLGYLIAATMSYILFTLLLKWQPFGSRLLLPVFVLWAPHCAAVLHKWREGLFVWPVVAIMLVCALPWFFLNASRPLLSPPQDLVARFAPGIKLPRSVIVSDRVEQYYVNKPEFRISQEGAARSLLARNCQVVGLEVGADYWEYTLWIQLQLLNERVPRLEHLNVNNKSADSGHFLLINNGCIVKADQQNITRLLVE